MRPKLLFVMRPRSVGTPATIAYLYNYKSQNGGTAASGWSKTWYAAYRDPYTYYGDISTPIGTQTWEVGTTLFVGSWYMQGSWYAGTFGYTNDDTVTTTASASWSATIKAFDASEVIQGTAWTGSGTHSSFQSVTIASLVITDQTFLGNAWIGGSGSWEGTANGFLLETSWSGSATTTGDPPIVGGTYDNVTAYHTPTQVPLES